MSGQLARHTACTREPSRHLKTVVYHPEIAITHFGRASTRQHIGYAYCHTAAGLARYLRRTGCPRPALWFYKAVLTFDAPVQWAGYACQYLWRLARGQHAQAAKTRLVLRGLGAFLARGLVPFWKA